MIAALSTRHREEGDAKVDGKSQSKSEREYEYAVILVFEMRLLR